MKTNQLSHRKILGALACALMFSPALRAAPTPSNSVPFISVIASDGVALEGTSSGAFTLLRAGPTNADVTVTLGISGTASNGVDYGPITNTVTIPAGNLAVDIPIVPLIDTIHRGNKTVVLTVETNAAYSASTRHATVEIIDDIYNIPPPTIALTNPVEGSVYTNPATITLTAVASDADVAITRVSFYANDSFLGAVSNSPYILVWTNAGPGHYALFARAVDTVDQSTLSGTVHITVTNLRPVVAFITPTNGAVLPGGNIPVSASATETGGTIKNVSFFSSTDASADHFIGTVSNAPYGLVWSNVLKGKYALYAVAKDATGGTGYASIGVTVTNPSPAKPVVPTNSQPQPPPLPPPLLPAVKH